MIDSNIADLRKRYTKGGLSETDLPAQPIELFRRWFDEALKAEVPEPNAMTLATVSPHGLPNARMVLLKGVEDGIITFFTNYSSRKGKDLESNPNATCVFWWAELERQVRISGPVKKLDKDESRDYFNSRPRESRIGAWASDQSAPLKNREELQKRFQKLSDEYNGKDVPMPDHWGGYEIRIEEIEFWQGRPGRLHDRIEYQLKKDGGWKRTRLAP